MIDIFLTAYYQKMLSLPSSLPSPLPSSHSVKVLAIGDLHIQPDTLAEVNIFLRKLDEYLHENPVDIIVILGDTLHTHETVYTECLNKMLEYVKMCEKHAQTEVLVGNHDYLSNSQFLTDAHPFSGWKGSHNIVDTVKVKIVKGKKLILLPYVPDGRFLEALRTVEGGRGGREEHGEWKDADCIFAHQLLDGVKMGPILVKGVEKWDESFPMVISGHIHDKQLVQPNLWYTGSSMQISFGERDDHTVSLITLRGSGGVEIKEIDIHPPRKKTVYLDMNQLSRFSKLPEEEDTKVKLSLSGDVEEFRTFKKSAEYKQLLQKGVKVVFKQKRSVPTNLPSTQHRFFPDILYHLVEDNPEMLDLYNQVIGEQEREIVFE